MREQTNVSDKTGEDRDGGGKDTASWLSHAIVCYSVCLGVCYSLLMAMVNEGSGW